MDAVKAGSEDLKGVQALLDYYSLKGVLTPRTVKYVTEHLSEFVVCKRDGAVVGCCALHRVSDGTAEVRCFAVKEDSSGMGVGKILLDFCLQEAKAAGLKRVFTLTLEGEFFKKSGFTKMSKLKIPLPTFRNEPEFNAIKMLRWLVLFLKMISTESAYEIRL